MNNKFGDFIVKSDGYIVSEMTEGTVCDPGEYDDLKRAIKFAKDGGSE